MTNILIIGNGFDLYHGLPTRYSDFLIMMKCWDIFYEAYMDPQSTLFDVDRKQGLIVKPNLDYNSVRELGKYKHIFDDGNIKHLNDFVHSDNMWLKYFTDNYNNKEKWVDFESDMEKAIQNVMEIFNDEKAKKIFFDNFITTYTKFTDSDCHSSIIQPVILNSLKNDLNDFIEAMRIYFVEFIDKAMLSKYSSMIASLNISAVISFNYTRTYEKLYSLEGSMHIHYIHGNVSLKNMVLGIKDENDIDNRFVYFKKYFQRVQKRTGLQYKNWLNNPVAQRGDIKFYVIGHSLDNTDGDFFREIINSSSTHQVIIYYHNQTAYEEQVINLIEVLEKDEFLAAYDNKKIIFKQLPPAEEPSLKISVE